MSLNLMPFICLTHWRSNWDVCGPLSEMNLTQNIIYSHLLTPDYYVILIIPLLFPGLQCPGFDALHGSLALVSELFANDTYRSRFELCQVNHLEAEVNRKLL